MTTDWRSDVNTKDRKKCFKATLRAELKQSELTGNFRQNSLVILVQKKKKKKEGKAYQECHMIKRAPESLCAGTGMGNCIGVSPKQLILDHASVLSAGTDCGWMPVRKCLEVLIFVLSKLSTAKMEKTISLR